MDQVLRIILQNMQDKSANYRFLSNMLQIVQHNPGKSGCAEKHGDYHVRFAT
jgi:hypothetical protein